MMPDSLLARLIKMRIFGKSPVSAFLRVNEWLWNHLPSALMGTRLMRSYGRFTNHLVRLRADRRQYLGTFFFRNRPELELIRRVLDQKEKDSTLRIAVIGCSNGSEVYSILWTVRTARPDLKVVTHALDISSEALALARNGVYSRTNPEVVGEQIFARITEEELQEMFEREGDQVAIKQWLKEGIVWHLGDARDPELPSLLGPQGIVVANNFLCHMDPPEGEECLRNLARLSRGYLLVSGVDLDVRTKVARDLGWKPVEELLENIHDGDPVLRDDWPLRWWGLEPLDKRRRDWQIRYASVFRLGEAV